MSDAGLVNDLEVEWENFVGKFAAENEQAKQRIRKVSEEIPLEIIMAFSHARSIFSQRKT